MALKNVDIDKWFFSTNFIESFIAEDLERGIRRELQRQADSMSSAIWFYTLIGTIKREAKRQTNETSNNNGYPFRG